MEPTPRGASRVRPRPTSATLLSKRWRGARVAGMESARRCLGERTPASFISSQRGRPRLRCKRAFCDRHHVASAVCSAILLHVDCECHVRRFFLNTQPRPGGALLCAARFPVVETAAMARADRSKPQIDEAIGALPDSSPRKIRTASSEMRKRTWVRLPRIPCASSSFR